MAGTQYDRTSQDLGNIVNLGHVNVRVEQPYDRHHAQIYIANFSGPWRRLKELGLLTLEVNDCEYRFKDVIDLETREVLFTVEHEVRSATHPMYLRPLVNRDPAQTNRTYAHGHDQWPWAMGPDEYDRR